MTNITDRLDFFSQLLPISGASYLVTPNNHGKPNFHLPCAFMVWPVMELHTLLVDFVGITFTKWMWNPCDLSYYRPKKKKNTILTLRPIWDDARCLKMDNVETCTSFSGRYSSPHPVQDWCNRRSWAKRVGRPKLNSIWSWEANIVLS